MEWTDLHSEGVPGDLVASFGRFPVKQDNRGRLVVIEWRNLPERMPPPLRVFTASEVPYTATRGNHANRTLHEILVCTAHGFTVAVEHPFGDRTEYDLSVGEAVYVPPWRWITVSNMGVGAGLLCIASAFYDRAERIDDRDEFFRGPVA